MQRSVALARSIHSAPMGTPSPAQRVLLGEGRSHRRAPFPAAHHRCLGSRRGLPYSADRGKKSVNRQALDDLKQQIPLMGYLQAHDWTPARPLSRGRWMGLCPLHALREAGLVSDVGYDAYVNRIVFPLEGNLYGRSLSPAAPPHRFLPGSKGGLYAWKQTQSYPEVILVEGLLDYAVLWQAGFHNVTCSLGTHLNARQFRQLCDAPRTVYLAFDADRNGSGQQAAQSLACRLREQSVNVRRVSLPEGHDPNSFFVQGGDAQQFQLLLEAARP